MRKIKGIELRKFLCLLFCTEVCWSQYNIEKLNIFIIFVSSYLTVFHIHKYANVEMFQLSFLYHISFRTVIMYTVVSERCTVMMHIQNVPRQSVPRQNVPRHKVPGTKRPRDKTSQGTKRPKGTNEAIISYVWPIT